MAARVKSWSVDIQNRVNFLNLKTEAELWNKQSIYRVPRFLKELNPKAYKPQVASFGPYHHGDLDVSPMEEHKQRALLHFLKRANKPLEYFVRGMEEIVQQLQDSYQDLDQEWRDRGKFLQLMIVDGCFMLEFMSVALRRINDYSPNDPIFSDNGKMYNLPHIHRDMLMVENQLPLLVLEKLDYLRRGEMGNEGEITKLVLEFVACRCNVTIPTAGVGLGLLHPLDLYRTCLIQSSRPSRSPSLCHRMIIRWAQKLAGIRKSAESSLQLLAEVRLEELSGGQNNNNNTLERPAGNSRSPSPGIIRSAQELDEAGIWFKKSKTNSPQDITFHGNVLRLPEIVFDDSTEYLFLNLMAFERLHVGAGNEVTSYVFFMDDIIDSAQDVSLLRSKGIIHNAVGSDKALANIVNALSKEAVAADSGSTNLHEVKRKLNNYCQKKWNRWRANLIRTYFRSPWSILSLLAAIFLLALTFAQTLYTVLAYYHPPTTTDDMSNVGLSPPPSY